MDLLGNIWFNRILVKIICMHEQCIPGLCFPPPQNTKAWDEANSPTAVIIDIGVFGPLRKVWSQVLKEYKFETKAARVDKEVCSSLLAKMWPQVLLPKHLIADSGQLV